MADGRFFMQAAHSCCGHLTERQVSGSVFRQCARVPGLFGYTAGGMVPAAGPPPMAGYAGGQPVFLPFAGYPRIFVLLASAAVVWVCARGAAPGAPARRRWLAAGLAAALGPLLLLKYYAMFAGTLNGLLGLTLWQGQGLIQPLGLAYYSLQLTSYLLDAHRGETPPEPNFARVLCYTSFSFPSRRGLSTGTAR